MLIVWRGYGWLVPVVTFGVMILSQLAIDALYGDGFYTANAWPKTAAIIVAALSVGVLGIYLNHIKRETVVDEETGEVLGKAPSHYLFFIPVEYWAVIIPAVFYWASS
jgi:hypothetical protein